MGKKARKKEEARIAKTEADRREKANEKPPGRAAAAEDYRVSLATFGRDWPILLLLLGVLAAAAIVYPHLPAQVPGHFDVNGKVDRYTTRAFAAFFYPLLVVWIYLMMVLLPLVDPKRQNYARFAGAYRLLRGAIVVFMSGIWAVTIMTGLGYSIDAGLAVKGGTGLLFLLTGSLMDRIRFNYFVGIRTPWTLASEQVWEATHRFAARVWVLGSLLLLLGAAIPGVWGAVLFLGIVAMMVLGPIIFSYVEFNGLKKDG